MTKFRFSLRRVLDYRRLRAHVARAALERLHAEGLELARREQALRALRAEEETAVRMPGTSLSVKELDALDRMQSYFMSAQSEFQRERMSLSQRIAEQQSVVVEADRQVSLLEKLESRRQTEWEGAFNRELEELAADSHRSRQHRLR
jgi:hypothetical protein